MLLNEKKIVKNSSQLMFETMYETLSVNVGIESSYTAVYI